MSSWRNASLVKHRDNFSWVVIHYIYKKAGYELKELMYLRFEEFMKMLTLCVYHNSNSVCLINFAMRKSTLER
jgi:hypothetical protein